MSHPIKRIVEALPEVVWLREAATGVFRYCSPAAERIWGCSAEVLQRDSRRWWDLIHPDDHGRVAAAWRACASGAALDVEYQVRRADGTIRWVHDRGEVQGSPAGDSVCLAGLARHITRRKRLEAEVTKAYDALHSSPNGVIITDLSGRITYANPAFLNLFQFTEPSAAVGLPAATLFGSEAIEETAGSGEREESFWAGTREFFMKRKDGSRVAVEVSTSDVHDAQGSVMGSMASFLDVTERWEREQDASRHYADLVRLAERMADMEERERRRISSLLHDTAVQSFSLSNVRLGAVSKTLGESGLSQARRQLEAAREMIADGIRQCRLVMADLTPPLLYEVGFTAAVRQFAERVQMLQGIPVALEADAAGDGIPEALRGVLFQVTRELVMNACKHAAPSKIRIHLACSPSEARLVVCDDGAGFDPAGLRGRRDAESGGVGLVSVQQRLLRFGGELQMESSPGRGTTMRVVVPLHAGPQAEDPDASGNRAGRASPGTDRA